MERNTNTLRSTGIRVSIQVTLSFLMLLVLSVTVYSINHNLKKKSAEDSDLRMI
jgi:hypothetical protein